MLDIKLIRENPEKINELLKRRNPELSIDTIIAIDADRRKVQAQADELRAKRKLVELNGSIRLSSSRRKKEKWYLKQKVFN